MGDFQIAVCILIELARANLSHSFSTAQVFNGLCYFSLRRMVSSICSASPAAKHLRPI
jgi:hypothetical protein